MVHAWEGGMLLGQSPRGRMEKGDSWGHQQSLQPCRDTLQLSRSRSAPPSAFGDAAAKKLLLLRQPEDKTITGTLGQRLPAAWSTQEPQGQLVGAQEAARAYVEAQWGRSTLGPCPVWAPSSVNLTPTRAGR